MALTKYTSGINTSFSTELNANMNALFEQQGLNHITQLQDRAVTYSAGQVGGRIKWY